MSAPIRAAHRYAPLVGIAGWATVAITGSLANTPGNIAWYNHQRRPSWRPPNWLFAPAWTGLYALLAASTTRVLRAPASTVRDQAIRSYAVNAVLNALWSWLFFAWKLRGPAAFEIALLLASLIVMLSQSAQVDRPAALMLVPYLAWVAFASALSFEVWRLNR
jgi:benzodiazapine receptor